MGPAVGGCGGARGLGRQLRPLHRGRPVTRFPVGSVLAASVVLVGHVPAAHAHVEENLAQGLLTGLLHPVSGLDHAMAMVLVGVWGAQLGRPAIWLLPVAFPIVMAVGGFLGLVGVALPGVEFGVALSALILGIMVALERRPALAMAAALVGAFAVFHGHAHGTELPLGQSGLTYSIGFVVATGCLHALGVLIGVAYRWPTGRRALRIAGACAAAIGALLVAQAAT